MLLPIGSLGPPRSRRALKQEGGANGDGRGRLLRGSEGTGEKARSHSPGTERSVRQSGERAPRRKRARTGAELRQCRARAHRCQPWGPGGAGESWSGRRQGRPSAEENLRARAEMGSGVGSPSETLRVRWLLLVGLLSPALGGARSGGCPPPGTFRDSSFLGPGCSEFLPRGA